jgi:hypothetical protein
MYEKIASIVCRKPQEEGEEEEGLNKEPPVEEPLEEGGVSKPLSASEGAA